jgi:hypothetical protein
VNIAWNNAEFVAEFSQDFQGDLNAVKNAGFKTTGPPDWRWYTIGVKGLNKLREKRPSSGLTISPEALAVYTRLNEIEAKNAEVRAQLAIAKKAQKKEQKKKAEEEPDPYWGKLTEEKWWIGAEDLPPWVSALIPKIRPILTSEQICEGCGIGPLSPLDYPTLCLWCSKTNILEENIFQEKEK